jgi:hypothetical protein
MAESIEVEQVLVVEMLECGRLVLLQRGLGRAVAKWEEVVVVMMAVGLLFSPSATPPRAQTQPPPNTSHITPTHLSTSLEAPIHPCIAEGAAQTQEYACVSERERYKETPPPRQPAHTRTRTRKNTPATCAPPH